ncbi:hypothetical protein QO206_13990 [Leeuwenhoekiella aequorea]|uniref:hypothetical protein n=1 Tax=Leeuwenhoekiella aequorea TaxID=283736 RepID=UPI00352CBDCE|tara:strand:+ start:19438 stop:19830 length:393 start_codon:yes stop_codon:yes gene_type:complete
MKSVDFLGNSLEILHDKFSNCNIRYEFISKTNVHLVEVTPFDFYNDESYIDEELLLEEEFESLYPHEEIVFISVDSLNKIENPLLELYSKKEGMISADFSVTDNLVYFTGYVPEDYENENIIENNYALAA